MDDRTPEDILDECIERLIGGEPVDALLAAYPGQADALMPALRSARLLLSAPATRASDAARFGAMRRMLSQIETSTKPQGAGGLLGAFKRRPVAFQAAALATGIALFGALGVGASAATGTTPEPVRQILPFFSDSQIRVEFTGVVTDADLATSTLEVTAGADVRTVRVTPSTEISRGGEAIAFGDLPVGSPVEVKGTLQPDDTILASRVHLEDDNGASGTPGADPTAEAGSPDGADDDGGGGNSGPGGGDDDDSSPSDNSGPGSGDEGEDRTPTPGSSSTPDNDDDNSGPGGSGDDGGDNSGHGGGDDGTPAADDTPEPSR